MKQRKVKLFDLVRVVEAMYATEALAKEARSRLESLSIGVTPVMGMNLREGAASARDAADRLKSSSGEVVADARHARSTSKP